jgi:hypothetical protein
MKSEPLWLGCHFSDNETRAHRSDARGQQRLDAAAMLFEAAPESCGAV